MDNSLEFMRRCIELAALGAGKVSPNPMVGAVIVHQGKIIGEGLHRKYGESHAEVNAVNAVLESYENAAQLLKESVIYVSLEPCAHQGKTPPCADLLIRHELKKVVVGCRDPFEHVNGRGIEKLRQAGIEVVENVLKDECVLLNRRFFTRVKKQRPYIILKWAQTADHFFAPDENQQRWISSEPAAILNHRWRTEEDAVLVGKNTAMIDNPQLNVRKWTGRDPKRIVIDRNLELPASLNIFDQSQDTIIFNAKKTDVDGRIKYLELEDFDRYLPQLICYQLYLMDIQSVIIEGGAKTLEMFINAGLWDESRIFTSPDYWITGTKAPDVGGRVIEDRFIGRDRLRVLLNGDPGL